MTLLQRVLLAASLMTMILVFLSAIGTHISLYAGISLIVVGAAFYGVLGPTEPRSQERERGQ